MKKKILIPALAILSGASATSLVSLTNCSAQKQDQDQNFDFDKYDQDQNLKEYEYRKEQGKLNPNIDND